MNFSINVEEEEAQLLMLALAELALSRPGWNWTLGELAEKFHGKELFEAFKKTSADRVKETHMPLGPLTLENRKLEWPSERPVATRKIRL